jgi:hypothetical protein
MGKKQRRISNADSLPASTGRGPAGRRAKTLQPGPAKGSVRNLQELYTVAVGVALVKAMEVFVRPSAEHAQAAAGLMRAAEGAALVAFVATLIPFYHGAMRHLEQTYVENEGIRVHRYALLADFLWLFVEACMLLGIALQLDDPVGFTWWLIVLLCFDSVWGILVSFGLRSEPRRRPEFKWAIINIPTAALLMFVVLQSVKEGVAPNPNLLLTLVAAVAVVRSIIDYVWSWTLYFPMDASEGQV